MSLIDDQIKKELKEFSEKHGPVAIEPVTVLEINGDDTIKVRFGDDSEIEDVRLKSIVANGNKVVLIPKENSIVQVGKIGNSDEYVVIAVHEVKEVLYIIDGVKFSVTSEGFLIKKDNDTIKEIFQLIIESQQKIMVMYGQNPDYTKLSKALTKLNNLFR